MLPNICECAWSVGELDVRAYLQDEVVSQVPCHRKGMCLQVLGLQLSLYIYSLGQHSFGNLYPVLLLTYASDTKVY